jgi:hypothetical protein
LLLGYFFPTPRKGKIRGSIRTNRAMMADFAFSSADTKLGRFDNSFFSAVPFPGGLYFAFGPSAKRSILSPHAVQNPHF